MDDRLAAKIIACALTSALLGGLSAAAAAQESGLGELQAGVSVGQVDEDAFVTLSLGVAAQLEVPRVACYGLFPPPADERDPDASCTTRLRGGVLVPLRLRVWDRDPQSAGTLRSEDWDEPSDWLRVLRFVEYGRPREAVYGRAGQLDGVLVGHGTIVNGYFNTIDVDHAQFGLNAALNDRMGGVELLLDNFADPEVMAARLYARPGVFFAPGTLAERWAVGATLALDIDAPERFARVDVSVDPNLPLAVTPERNLIPERTDVTGVFGIDNELLLVQEEVIDFTPFFDMNFNLDGSPGLHLGAFTALRPLDELHLNLRTELRWLGEHYLPDYFGPLYEIERNTYFGYGGTGSPKRVVLDQLDQGQRLGAYGEVSAQIYRFLQLFGAYEDYQGPRNANIQLGLRLTDLGPVRVGATFRRYGFNGLSDALELPNALLILEAQARVLPWLYVGGQYNRLYRLQPSGAYETVNDWSLGAGVVVGF